MIPFLHRLPAAPAEDNPLWLIVLAVGVSHAPQVARVLRAATLDISERDFVKAIELGLHK